MAHVLTRLGLELHPEKTRLVDLSHGCEGFDFLGCHLRKRMSGLLWERTRQRLRGWGQYFRTGNAANHFTALDADVERRLRGLRIKRANGRLAAGQGGRWDRSFFETLGLCRLRGTIQYPGAA